MSDIKITAIKKAIGLLAAAGAQFKVIHDGEVLIDTLPKAPEPGRRTRKPSGIKFKPLFEAQANTLEDNPVQTFHVPEGIDVRAYRGALAGFLTVRYGHGTCITQIHPETNTVEVLYAR